MVALVVSMQGAGLGIGPLIAMALLSTGMSHDYAWRIMLALGAMLLPFLLLFGAAYFFSEFGPNTTTFVYPAEIFPVRVRTTCHGVARWRGWHIVRRAGRGSPRWRPGSSAWG
jgi:MFS family permease